MLYCTEIRVNVRRTFDNLKNPCMQVLLSFRRANGRTEELRTTSRAARISFVVLTVVVTNLKLKS